MLKKTTTKMQKELTGIKLGERKVQVLGLDDLNILGSLLNETKRAAQVLEQAIDKVGKSIGKKRR